MKKRIFFTFTYFIFAIIIFVLASRTSLAFGDDCIYVGPSGGEDTRTGCELHRIRECRIKLEEIKEEILLEEDIYDTNNNFLGKGLLIKDKYKFVAGRFIGVDAYEKHIITYVVSITPICLEPN